MMAHNLCYTTLVTKREIQRLGLADEDYVVTPTNSIFFYITTFGPDDEIYSSSLMFARVCYP